MDGIGVARAVAAEMVRAGAEAAALMGSYARGDAGEGSDLDLVVVGDGPEYLLSVREGLLVSQAWASEEEHRRLMTDPGEVGTAVPGWRQAVLVHDPDGVAARLRDVALEWSWQGLGDEACDRWVADRVVSFAEEHHKLSSALRRGRTLMAAVQRDLLALHLAPALAVHLRLLYGTENDLWDLVGDALGADWQAAQAAAFATGGETFAASCQGALKLYRLAVEAMDDLLDDQQRAVVRHALALVGGDADEGGGDADEG